jgi:hypothetical protein
LAANAAHLKEGWAKLIALGAQASFNSTGNVTVR